MAQRAAVASNAKSLFIVTLPTIAIRQACCRAAAVRPDSFKCATSSVPDAYACGLVERGAQSPGKLEGIVIGPEVQEDQARVLGQHVTMDRGDLDAVRPQGLDHGIDFGGSEHVVTRN